MWAYVPLLLSVLFGSWAPVLARRLPPGTATWLLSAGGVLAAAASSSALAMLAFDVLARTPLVASLGGWSKSALRSEDPVSLPVGVLAGVGVVVLAIRFGTVATRRLAATLAAHRLSATLPGAGSELSVVHSEQREAFAVPGRPGRIAVTSAMLRSLDAGQRRALLAHERSHLDRHHHLHHTAVHLAVAVNPLLRRLPAAVELATERWADEDAARLCPRDTVAAALTVASSGARRRAPAVVLGAGGADVTTRILALRGPARRLTVSCIAPPVAVLIAMTVAVAVAMRDTEHLFEVAQQAYRVKQR